MSGARRFGDEEEFPIDEFHGRRTNSLSNRGPHHSHHSPLGERQSRASRNSTGAKEELVVESLLSDLRNAEKDANATDHDINGEEGPPQEDKKDGKMLAISFVAMVFVGLGNKVFNKLMTIPMYNYPNFLNLLTSFVYIPVCFSYIIPMTYYNKIPAEQFEVPKRTFAVMGALDALAGIMQIFGATYLPGPLIILMLQAAIPVSMVISKYLIKARYNLYQYTGALIVAGGILIVLGPSLTGGGDIIWAMVLILSTIPMALSSVYKEIALGETELDAMYLNGWVAVFQFLFSIVLAVPSSLASDPPVPIPELPANLYNGLKCYVGISTLKCDDDGDDCVSDSCNPQAPEFVNIYLVFNQFYNLLIILILKYGSSNLLYLALTLMVPLGNIAFTLPFIPQNAPLQPTDIAGLIVICLGLGTYRFAKQIVEKYYSSQGKPEKPYETLGDSEQPEDEQKQQLFSKLIPAEEGHNSASNPLNADEEGIIRA